MSFVDIAVDGLDTAISNMDSAEALMDGLGEGLLEVVDSVLLPEIMDASATVWNVRTGNYMGGWTAGLSDPNTVTIINGESTGVPYAAPLEYGWTLRNGGFMDSPGVGIPTTLEMAESIGQGLAEWITSQLPQ